MRLKNSNPASLLPSDADALIRLYFEINHLKQLYRQGWLKEGREIPENCCESVAEHVFGMAVLALLFCDTHDLKLDRAKVHTMILVHEFGEVRDGDRFIQDDRDKQARHAAERAGIVELLKDFPHRDAYIALWEEFEKGETPEARFVRELDKIEMVLQSKVYSLQHGKDLSEFIATSRKHIWSAEMQAFLERLEAL
jgi:putative hydrolases of HD superfamily